MKTFYKIISVFISSIIIVLSLAFIVIEGRLLLSGDYLSYDSPFFGFLRYFCRLLLALFAFIKALFEIIYINKKHNLLYADIALVLMSLIIIIYSSNYVGVLCITLSIISLLINLLVKKNKKML